MAFMYGLTPETLAQLSPYLRKRNNGQADLLPIDYGQATQPPPSGGIAFEPQVVAGMPMAPEEPVMFGPGLGMQAPMPPISAQPIALEPSAIATRQMPSMVAETPAIDLASVLPPPQEYVAPEPVVPAPAKPKPATKPKAEQMPEPAGVAPLLAGNLAIAPYLSSLAQAASEEEKKAVEKYQGEMTEGGGARIMMKQVDPETGEYELETFYQPATADKPATVTYTNPITKYPTIISADTQNPWEQEFFKRASEQYALLQAEKSPTRTIADSEQRSVRIIDGLDRERYYPYTPSDQPGMITLQTSLGASTIPVTQVPDYEKDPELLSIYQQGQAASPFGRLRAITGEPGGTFTIAPSEGEQPKDVSTVRSVIANRYLGERPVGTYRAQIVPKVTYVNPNTGGTFSQPADPDAPGASLMPVFSYEYGPDVPANVAAKLDARAEEMNNVVLDEYESTVKGMTPTEKPVDQVRMETVERQLKALEDEKKRLERIIVNNQSTPDQVRDATAEMATVDSGIAAKRRERISILTATTGTATQGIGGGRTVVTQGAQAGLTSVSNVLPNWNTIVANLMMPPAGTMEPQQGMAMSGQVVTPEQMASDIRDTLLREIDSEQLSSGSKQVQIVEEWSDFIDYLDDTVDKIRADAEEVYGLNSGAVLDMPINKNKRLTINSLYDDLSKVAMLREEITSDGIVTEEEVGELNKAMREVYAVVQNGFRVAGEAKTPEGKNEKFDGRYDGPEIDRLAETPFAYVEMPTSSNLRAVPYRIKRSTDYIKPQDQSSTVTPPPPQGPPAQVRYPYRPAWGKKNGTQSPIAGSSILNAVGNLAQTPLAKGIIMNEVLYSSDGYEQAIESAFATHDRPTDHTRAKQLAEENINAYNRWLWEKSDPNAAAARAEYFKAYFALYDDEGMGWFRAGQPGSIPSNLDAATFAADAEKLLQGDPTMTKAAFRAKYKIPNTVVSQANKPALDVWFRSPYAQGMKATGSDPNILAWGRRPFIPGGTSRPYAWRAGDPAWTPADHNTEDIGVQIIASLVDLTDALDLARNGSNIQADGSIRTGRPNAAPVSWLTSPGDGRRMFLSAPVAFQGGSPTSPTPLDTANGQTNPTGVDNEVVSTTDIAAANPIMKKIVSQNILRGFTTALVSNGPSSVKQNHAQIMRGVRSRIGGQRNMSIEAAQDNNVEYVAGQTEVLGAEAHLTQTIPMMMLGYNAGGSLSARRVKF